MYLPTMTSRQCTYLLRHIDNVGTYLLWHLDNVPTLYISTMYPPYTSRQCTYLPTTTSLQYDISTNVWTIETFAQTSPIVIRLAKLQMFGQTSFLYGPNPASFCLFSSFSQQYDKYRMDTKFDYGKSIDGVLWILNPGQQEGSCRRIHWALAPPGC